MTSTKFIVSLNISITILFLFRSFARTLCSFTYSPCSQLKYFSILFFLLNQLRYSSKKMLILQIKPCAVQTVSLSSYRYEGILKNIEKKKKIIVAPPLFLSLSPPFTHRSIGSLCFCDHMWIKMNVLELIGLDYTLLYVCKHTGTKKSRKMRLFLVDFFLFRKILLGSTSH